MAFQLQLNINEHQIVITPMTPYEKLKSLPESKKHLKDGVTCEIMDKIAYAMTDNESAEQLQKARQTLFKNIDERELNTG